MGGRGTEDIQFSKKKRTNRGTYLAVMGGGLCALYIFHYKGIFSSLVINILFFLAVCFFSMKAIRDCLPHKEWDYFDPGLFFILFVLASLLPVAFGTAVNLTRLFAASI